MISSLAASSVLRDTLNTGTILNAVQWQDILSILAAIFSALLVYVAWATLREHNRPYVTLFAETGNSGTIYLVLKNSGNRAAYNVKVITDVPIESAFFAGNPNSKLPLVTDRTHPFIGPDQILSGLFDYLSWRYEPNRPNYKVPCDKFTVTIQYRYKKRRFVEEYQLDLSYLAYVPWSYSQDHLGDISRSIKRISDQLPGGIIHHFQNMFNNAQTKSQEDSKSIVAESDIIDKDVQNEKK